MDDQVRHALDHSQTIDITTIGRRTGQPRRIEIFLHNLDGRLVISGQPRAGHTRAWIYNIAANPAVVLHLRSAGQAGADVPATARIITDPAERLGLIREVAQAWRRTDIEAMVAHSPLIELTVGPLPMTAA